VKPSEFSQRSAQVQPAVVVGVGCGVGLGIIRDLGQRGVPVLAVGSDSQVSALLSRYCLAEASVDPHYKEEDFIGELLALGSRLRRRGVMFAASDDSVAALSRHKARLEKHFVLPLLSWDRMRLLVDKEEQAKVAWRAGVETPVTAFIHGPDDLAEAAATVPFPAVLKPSAPLALRRRLGVKVIQVQTKDDLKAAYDKISFCGSLLLQEVVPGRDDAVLISGTYHDADSRPLAVFTGRKLRQRPRGFGDTRAGESRWSDELAAVTLRLLDEVRYHGVSDVEFKRDARDGRLKLIEVNARQGLWAPLATAAGVNLSYAAYRDAVGRPYVAPPQRDGVRWLDAVYDVHDSVGEMLRGELEPKEWLSSLHTVRADCLLSLHDPRPGLTEISRIAQRHLRHGLLRSTQAESRHGVR